MYRQTDSNHRKFRFNKIKIEEYIYEKHTGAAKNSSGRLQRLVVRVQVVPGS